MNKADGKTIEQFARVEVGGFGEVGQSGEIGVPADRDFCKERLEGIFLLMGEGGGGFDEVKVERRKKVGIVLTEGRENIEGEMALVGPLFDKVESGGRLEKGM